MPGYECASVSVSGSEADEAKYAKSVAVARQYRVRVCLQRFFSDERARCYVWVSGAQRVSWLSARLRRLFALPPHLALVSGGHLLPPAEPLAVLAPDDVVEVIHKDNGNLDDLRSVSAQEEFDSTTEPSPAKRVRAAAARHASVTSQNGASEVTTAADDELDEMKRRALILLEHISDVTDVSGAGACAGAPPSTRARRRRVRRRRALRSLDSSGSPRCSHSPHSPHSVGDTQEPRVQRNKGAATREPRAVISLAVGGA